MFEYIFQDWSANNGNPKGRLVLGLFRLASLCSSQPKHIRLLTIPYAIFYRIAVEWILGIEIPWKLSAGKGLILYHGVGLVINDKAKIGRNCILRHNTTIGVSKTSTNFEGDAPTIGDDVDIGAGAIIIGNIVIGSGCQIAAGSVVIHNVPPNTIVAGNPAKVIKQTECRNSNK